MRAADWRKRFCLFSQFEEEIATDWEKKEFPYFGFRCLNEGADEAKIADGQKVVDLSSQKWPLDKLSVYYSAGQAAEKVFGTPSGTGSLMNDLIGQRLANLFTHQCFIESDHTLALVIQMMNELSEEHPGFERLFRFFRDLSFETTVEKENYISGNRRLVCFCKKFDEMKTSEKWRRTMPFEDFLKQITDLWERRMTTRKRYKPIYVVFRDFPWLKIASLEAKYDFKNAGRDLENDPMWNSNYDEGCDSDSEREEDELEEDELEEKGHITACCNQIISREEFEKSIEKAYSNRTRPIWICQRRCKQYYHRICLKKFFWFQKDTLEAFDKWPSCFKCFHWQALEGMKI